MTTEVMLWQVTEGKLERLSKSDFSISHKEKDLEEWVKSDPSILGKNLTIIGQQIVIPKVGILDLLAVDEAGQLVVVEFKRQQTTRDTVAQILDYASSLRLMEKNQIGSLSGIDQKTLDRVDTIDPAMILVAANSDTSVERIVDYMVSKAHLPIEVVTFTYATLADGQEIIARSILVPDTPTAAKTSVGHMTLPDHIHEATTRKVDGLLRIIRQVTELGMWEEAVPSNHSYLRYWIETIAGNEKTLFSIDVVGGRFNSPEGGLDLWLYPDTAAEYTGLSPEATWEELEPFSPFKKTSVAVYIRIMSIDAANQLYEVLSHWKGANVKALEANKAGQDDSHGNMG